MHLKQTWSRSALGNRDMDTLCKETKKMGTFSLYSATWFALKACYCDCAIDLRRFYPVMDLI